MKKHWLKLLKKHWFKYLKKHWFIILFVSLVILIFTAPILFSYGFGKLLIRFTAIILVYSFVYTTIKNRKVFIVATVFTALLLVTNFNYIVTDTVSSKIIFYSLALLFYGFAVSELLVTIFTAKKINLNILFGSLCAYLLIGLFYANVYNLLETIVPGSFQDQFNPDQLISTFDIGYFSFTALSTVGFGDILPATDQAKSIVVLEEMTGVLFLAVIVSKLISFRMER